jgi:hypothetical protein
VQQRQPDDAEHLLPRVHRVASLLKRWLPSYASGREGPQASG